MSKFSRRRAESADEWLARLAREDAGPLTPDEVTELTLRRLLAERAVKRGRASPRGNPSTAGGEAGSGDLQRCKDAVRALSPEDRRELAQWLAAGADA